MDQPCRCRTPDKPPEERRKNILERLRFRAGREGKSVNMIDNVLYIDNVATFSLSSGFLQKQDA
jgi:hypothetical protein